jgi:PadR family transcriptional regulator PadR
MSGMATEGGLTELRRGVLGPCVLALLELRPRFGLELVRDLAAADGLLTSDGTVYPLLNRLRDAGLVTSEWRDDEGERARRYYFITEAGRRSLTAANVRLLCAKHNLEKSDKILTIAPWIFASAAAVPHAHKFCG